MKTNILISAILFINILFVNPVNSQKIEDALSYMDFMSKQYRKVMEDMWDYTSTSAHSKNIRKIESRRKDLLNTISKVQQSIAKMPDYQGDKGLRDTTVSYLKLSYNVLNNDYAKIVDLEEIAEQSYDMMEAYINAQEMANEKLDLSSQRLDAEQQGFAQKYNIKVSESKDKLGNKLEKATKVFKYYNRIYLIFFKSFKQDYFLSEALQKQDVNSIEQNRNSLLKFATLGAKKLDTLKGFGGDNSLKVSLKQLLEFYKVEASVKIPVLTNFYLKKEIYEKTKSEIGTKSEQERTKADVAQYNKALADYNKSIADYNRITSELSQKHGMLLESWDRAVQSFLDRQVPKK
jgi:hypothetical protein